MVAEFWPQWDWVDFRDPNGHESSLSDLVRAALGEPPIDGTEKKTTEADGAFAREYERRVRFLVWLRSVGLEKEVYMESMRKLAEPWNADPSWKDHEPK